MRRKNSFNVREIEGWEEFLRRFVERVSVADEKRLTVRCWKQSLLAAEIASIVRSLGGLVRTTFPSAPVVIGKLERMGWVQRIEVGVTGKGSVECFLVVGWDNKSVGGGYPLELLQAYLPDGVISYFSAMGYYELTTQTIGHHHISRLLASTPRKVAYPISLQGGGLAKKRDNRDPLGTEVFRFEGVQYYVNRRDPRFSPGIQLRVDSPRCWFRITTLEQTLLDALMQPHKCGGEAVVLEAWESGVSLMDPDLMADHLMRVDRDDLSRRVGAMLRVLGRAFSGTKLDRHLESIQIASRGAREVPLLSGLEFPDLDSVWMVRVP